MLTDDEVAFYDALEVNDSAVKVLGEPTLKDIARELVAHVRKSVTIDWSLREAAQAQIRVIRVFRGELGLAHHQPSTLNQRLALGLP